MQAVIKSRTIGTMKATGVVLILLLLLNGFANCQNFDYLINYEDDNIPYTVVFQVEATYNSVTGDVCANGVTNDTANLMCQNMFDDPTLILQATTTDYSTFMFNSVAYSVDCSSGIDTCPGTLVSNCDSYGGLLAVKCVIFTPECYSQSIAMLSNPVNTTIPSGGYYVTGHPVTCSSSGNYVPVCNSVNMGPLETMAICLHTTGNFGGFNGAPSGVTVPPPTLRFHDTVSNQFSCSDDFQCSGNSVMGTCPNGYATVTCQKVCDDDYGYTLYNSQTATIDGVNYTIGIPQFCLEGTYTRICNDGTNSPGYGLALCNIFGFEFGDLLPSNSSLAQTLYSGSPQGILYMNNFTCLTANCDGNPGFATNPQCYNGHLETALRCSHGIHAPCIGPSLHLHNNISRIVDGTEIVSGIPLNCVDGAYTSLCNDGSQVQSALNFLCKSMGFNNNSTILPFDASVYGHAPEGTAYFSSLSCPPEATTVDDCDAISSTNQQCLTGALDLVLQCSRVINNTAPSSHPSIHVSASSTTVLVTSSPTTSAALIIGLTVGIGVPVIIGVAFVILILLMAVFLMMKKKAGSRPAAEYRKMSRTSVTSDTTLQK